MYKIYYDLKRRHMMKKDSGKISSVYVFLRISQSCSASTERNIYHSTLETSNNNNNEQLIKVSKIITHGPRNSIIINRMLIEIN